MSHVRKRTFSLPAEQADYIDRKVATGTYASGSEVIREGLRALQERDEAIERWLREEVVPIAVEMEAHPERAIPANKVFAQLRAHHTARVKAARRGRA